MIDFQDFGIEDNERYLNYLRRCIQIPSNGSPTIVLGYKNILNVRRGYAANLCWHKNVIDGEECWQAPAGDWDETDWQSVFKEHVPPGTVFVFIPEYLVNIWRRELGDAIEVNETRDYWDYILDLDRIKKLEGKKFKAFRNAINSFEKNYNYTVEEITPAIFDELRAFQADAEEYLQERVEHIVEAKEDDLIFYFALNHWDELKNLFGVVLRVDGRIVAYNLDEQIDETYAIGLFAKADYEYKGANQLMYWYDAEKNLERGILTQNMMDDAGEEHLRFFKEHMMPLVMLKKYRVIYNPSNEMDFIKVHGLKISFERVDKDLTISLRGKLDTLAANEAKKIIVEELAGATNVIFDLQGLEYISSAGLRLLVIAMKTVKADGGTMSIKHVGKQVKEALTLTGFAQLLNVKE